MYKIVKCPVCQHRLVDIDEGEINKINLKVAEPKDLGGLQMKCPKCKRTITLLRIKHA